MIETTKVLNDVEKDMKQTIQAWVDYLGKVRTGRANASMLDTVLINYYGTMTPLNQTAQITTPEHHLIVVKPYDRNMVSEIVGGIHKADLGLNPVSDAEVVRIKIPTLTEDLRKELVKKVTKELEHYKVRIRNARRDGIDLVKKDKEVSEDVIKGVEKDIQHLTDKYIKELDDLTKAKEKDLLTI
ncbi:ribosome recycling factor [Williamsoniiplasma luminosum]|uniref:Ribosome-recycling factor n=1 Tax=Williamsoniiplasma luminosum TaxID=214888 RepID=A0A2K8NXV5_9MOLU|nr:ribosome recycling factor [Williamsoniiplasma luminosum]ATZ17473.1 ribosome recycling factor [Williamsoniiplasma luminosum]